MVREAVAHTTGVYSQRVCCAYQRVCCTYHFSSIHLEHSMFFQLVNTCPFRQTPKPTDFGAHTHANREKGPPAGDVPIYTPCATPHALHPTSRQSLAFRQPAPSPLARTQPHTSALAANPDDADGDRAPSSSLGSGIAGSASASASTSAWPAHAGRRRHVPHTPHVPLGQRGHRWGGHDACRDCASGCATSSYRPCGPCAKTPMHALLPLFHATHLFYASLPRARAHDCPTACADRVRGHHGSPAARHRDASLSRRGQSRPRVLGPRAPPPPPP